MLIKNRILFGFSAILQVSGILCAIDWANITFDGGRVNGSRHYPKNYIEKTKKIFNQRKGKIIVEIGSSRHPLNHDIDNGLCAGCRDGHSTYLWAMTLAQVYSVDISASNTKMTKEICKEFKNLTAVTEDGVKFLKSFNKSIDLLFLDAWDAVPGTRYAESHLEAYLAAKPKLHDKSLILIDDTDIDNGGKGRLVIPQAIKDGYKIIFSGRQTLLAK